MILGADVANTSYDSVFDDTEENIWLMFQKSCKLDFIVAIPLFSISNERVGSPLNMTIQDKRTSLDPDKVQHFIFINSNLDLKDFAE